MAASATGTRYHHVTWAEQHQRNHGAPWPGQHRILVAAESYTPITAPTALSPAPKCSTASATATSQPASNRGLAAGHSPVHRRSVSWRSTAPPQGWNAELIEPSQSTTVQIYCRLTVTVHDPEVVTALAVKQLQDADIDWSVEKDDLVP